MSDKYRKKPIVIEAMQLIDDGRWNDILEFLYPIIPDIMVYTEPMRLKIPTLEGYMIANKGDYIIKGIENEFYPCQPSIFHATYEEVAGEIKSSCCSASLIDTDTDDICSQCYHPCGRTKVVEDVNPD